MPTISHLPKPCRGCPQKTMQHPIIPKAEIQQVRLTIKCISVELKCIRKERLRKRRRRNCSWM